MVGGICANPKAANRHQQVNSYPPQISNCSLDPGVWGMARLLSLTWLGCVQAMTTLRSLLQGWSYRPFLDLFLGEEGEVQRGQRADKHPKKPGLVPQFMWGIGKALGGPRKFGGRGGLLCEYPVSLSWGEWRNTGASPLGKQAIETTNPQGIGMSMEISHWGREGACLGHSLTTCWIDGKPGAQTRQNKEGCDHTLTVCLLTVRHTFVLFELNLMFSPQRWAWSRWPSFPCGHSE